ncbi:elongation factor 4 [bacterium]|nr:elongation factor 4 [bacterium]
MHTARIRNFSIIAHIDHGKSTLADRLLEYTHTVPDRRMEEQVLDSMDLERERGITIKSHAIRIDYNAKDGKSYILNLIDTPGHVDFTYEVSRSLAACEGVLLLVDASQGIEAQTISNLYLALEANLTIIPVLTKIDLPASNTSLVGEELCELLDVLPDELILTSAKEGIGTEEILESIISRIPPPVADDNDKLRALIFDSMYNTYRGVIIYTRVFEGSVKAGDIIKFFTSGNRYEVDEVGYLRLDFIPAKDLQAGEVGYIIANIKRIEDAKVGDTITQAEDPATKPLPGYRDFKPMVYSGLYPTDNDDFEDLRDALSKLKLNDASLFFEPETSVALGFGFRCGFLGMLHLDIIKERLSREYGMNLIATVPNVEYRVDLKTGEEITIDNPSMLPDPVRIDAIEEPFVEAEIITDNEFIGNVMQLIMQRRGEYKTTEYIDPAKVMIYFTAPLSEIIFDFFDKLKSITKGYASLDYKFTGYKPSDLVKLDILINDDPVDALSSIIHRDKSYLWGQRLCSKLRELIPRQLFEVKIQAAIGARVVSKSKVHALRKNVTAKCYGGDITRKRKLLEQQKEGKKKMKQVGNVSLPQEAFFAILEIEKV